MRTVRQGTAGIAGAVLLLAAWAGPASAAPVPAAAASVAAGAVAAGSGTAAQLSNVVEIVSTADTLTAPSSTTAGPTTFHATTTAEGSGWIGLARLKDGVSWERFHHDMRRTLSTNRADIIAGSRDLTASATLLGGAIIHAGVPGSFTQRLRPGTYLLFDYFDLAAAPQPRHRTLTVTGTAPAAAEPAPTATVVSAWIPGTGPRFSVLGDVRPGAPFRFVNLLPGQINEAVFIRVRDDTTEAELAAFIAAIGDNGEFPPNPPFISFGLGSLPLSTGQSSAVQVPLPPGRYALMTFIKSAQDGVLLAKKGLFTIVDVQ